MADANQNTQKVDVEFQAKGLGRLKASWADFAGDLLEPVAILAAGGSKVQAAWAGAASMFQSRVLGPIGLAAGLSIGFLATTWKLVGAWKQMGMSSASGLETLTLQFKPLLGNLAAAKERVRELVEFTNKTPWHLDEAAAANKTLESLTRGALSSKAGMMLVGDAAAVAGAGFQETATSVGRLYDGLMSGRPVGEAAQRLQELGLISGTTRNQIEAMQAANVSGIETWAVVEKQLQRNKGAQDALGESLEGLRSTQDDTKTQMNAGFSGGFMEGEKAGVKSSIKMMEAIAPLAKDLGGELGRTSNAWENFKLKTVEAVTGSKAFGPAVEAGTRAVVAFAVATTALAAGKTLAWLFSLATGYRSVAAQARLAAVAEGAQVPAMAKLTSAKNSLVAALRATRVGLIGEATGHLGAAAGAVKNITATNGVATATKGASFAMKGLGVAGRFVGAQLVSLFTSLLSPAVLFTAAVVGLGMAWSHHAEKVRQAKEAQEDYEKASSAMSSKIGSDIREVRTLTDQRRVEAEVVRELAQAYTELTEAKLDGNKEREGTAAGKVEGLKAHLEQVRKPKFLERSQSDLDLERGLADREIEAARMRAEQAATNGPEEEAKRAAEALKEVNDRRRESIESEKEELRVTKAMEEAQRKVADATAQQGALIKSRGELQANLAQHEKGVQDQSGALGNSGARLAHEQKVVEIRKQLLEVDSQLSEIDRLKAGGGSTLEIGLGSTSELQVLRAKVAVYGELEASLKAIADAEDEAKNEKDAGKLAQLRQNLDLLKATAAAQQKVAEQAGVAGWVGNPGFAQAAKGRISDIESRRADDEDPAKIEAAAQRRRDAEAAVVRARLEAEAQIAALRMEGYDREKMLLSIEQQKLEAKKQAGQIGEKEYERQRELLAARGESMEKEARERGLTLRSSFEQARLARLAEEARHAGNQEQAKMLEAAAEARADEETRRQAKEEAKGVNTTDAGRDAYVEARVKEQQEARAADKKRRDEDQAAGRARSQADQASGVAGLQERLLKMQGKTKESKEVRDVANKRQDELDRAEMKRKFIDQGFGGDEAGAMAGKQMKMNQANRILEQMSGAKGSVVASSLAQIGAGGGAYGNDPNTKLLEELKTLLQKILSKDTNGIL